MAAQLDRRPGDLERCCHVGVALLLFALGWFGRRKPASAPDWFTAHPVPWSGFTSPNSRPMPPRHGRAVTGPPTPKLNLPVDASGTPLPAPRAPGNGRRSNAPHRSLSGYTRRYGVISRARGATCPGFLNGGTWNDRSRLCQSNDSIAGGAGRAIIDAKFKAALLRFSARQYQRLLAL